MGIEKFAQMLKQANLSDGLGLLKKPAGIAPIAPVVKPPKPMELPKVETTKPPELKLDTSLGKKKPKFTHELKTNSPYNER